ncbi:MAG: metalloregulator ArsR/SmtB family transcription factor [Tunicatimonas sp.]
MGATKTIVFTDQQNQLADYAKALAHPARVAILQFLIQRNACVCGDIVDELPLSQSTVSQHLKELKRIGVVQGTIDGPRVCYCIDPAAWQRVKATISELFASFDLKNCC